MVNEYPSNVNSGRFYDVDAWNIYDNYNLYHYH